MAPVICGGGKIRFAGYELQMISIALGSWRFDKKRLIDTCFYAGEKDNEERLKRNSLNVVHGALLHWLLNCQPNVCNQNLPNPAWYGLGFASGQAARFFQNGYEQRLLRAKNAEPHTPPLGRYKDMEPSQTLGGADAASASSSHWY